MKKKLTQSRGLMFLCLSMIVPALSLAQGATPSAGTTTAVLDNGASITVDYVDYAPVNAAINSILAPGVIQTLVQAADRSTQSGCPYYAAHKGLFNASGDHIFITNNYIAWFDYTLSDGIGATSWPRSGTLAGYWSLDPSKADHAAVQFRHFYDPAQSVSGNTPNDAGLCWNWAHNELIPGSDSPLGGAYWWDTYAPAVEHTIVLETSSSPLATNLFSTNYAQNAPGSGFTLNATGSWDGVGGTHYTTSGFMATSPTSSTGAIVTSNALTPSQPGASPVTGVQLSYFLDYDAQENGIKVVWKFSSNKTVMPKNLYVDVWATYSGLGVSDTCGAEPAYPVPPTVLGVGSSPYHTFMYVQNSLPSRTSDIQNGVGVVTDNSGGAPWAIAPFPWGGSIPCNTVGGAAGFNSAVASTPINSGIPIAGIPIYATISAGYSPALSPSLPMLQLTNLVNPQQNQCNWNSPPTGSQVTLNPAAGNCPENGPASFPLNQMLMGYEHSDQQSGFLLVSQNTQQILQANEWYMISYMFTSQPFRPAANALIPIINFTLNH